MPYKYMYSIHNDAYYSIYNYVYNVWTPWGFREGLLLLGSIGPQLHLPIVEGDGR